MDATRLINWPFGSDSRTQRKNLTDASSSIAVEPGGYFVMLSSTNADGCTLKLDGAAVVPTTGSAEIVGMQLPPGAIATLVVRHGETALHGIMNTGSATGTLWLTRVR